jgi:hypothetical protein
MLHYFLCVSQPAMPLTSRATNSSEPFVVVYPLLCRLAVVPGPCRWPLAQRGRRCFLSGQRTLQSNWLMPAILPSILCVTFIAVLACCCRHPVFSMPFRHDSCAQSSALSVTLPFPSTLAQMLVLHNVHAKPTNRAVIATTQVRASDRPASPTHMFAVRVV